MMKLKRTYHAILLLAALMAVYGCGNLYTGDEVPSLPDTPDNPDGPEHPLEYEEVPVMLTFTDPSYTVFTRGQGSFDDKSTVLGNRNWSNARFYVYAFRSDNPTGMTFATTRKDDKEICLIDGSTQSTPDMQHGRLARLNENDGGAFFSWIDDSEPLYYSSLGQINPFNFFAYYIDDAIAGNFQRTAEDIRFDVEIDGTQDLLGSVASPTAEQLANIEALTDENERNNVKKYLYSTYTAHRNFHPVLAMKHYMSRLKFQMFPGGKENDSIYVQSVKIESLTKGTFTVAAKDTATIGVHFPNDGAKKDLILCDTTGLPLQRDSFLVQMTEADKLESSVYNRHHVKLGEDALLVVPAESYKLTIELMQCYADGRRNETYIAEYKALTVPGGFKPGTQYTIRIAVFGLEEIEVNVVVTPWADGGNVDLDPDDFFEQ